MNQQQIQDRIKSLPQDLQDAISSVEIGSMVAKIGDEEGLLIDQCADLMDQTAMVMIGLTPSKRFAQTLVEELGIPQGKADVLTAKINSIVLAKIRESLQRIQQEEEGAREDSEDIEPETTKAPIYSEQPLAPTPIPPTEPTTPARSVKIDIIPHPVSSSAQYNDSTLNREAVLNDLENIEKLKPTKAIDFVEHLLANPVSIPAEKVEIKKEVTPPPAPQKKYAADPYREQF